VTITLNKLSINIKIVLYTYFSYAMISKKKEYQ